MEFPGTQPILRTDSREVCRLKLQRNMRIRMTQRFELALAEQKAEEESLRRKLKKLRAKQKRLDKVAAENAILRDDRAKLLAHNQLLQNRAKHLARANNPMFPG